MTASRVSRRPSIVEAVAGIRSWPLRRWLVAAAAAVVVALIIGIPTGLISTPWYTRMTPVLWWNYPIWVVTVLLSGLVAGTYVRLGERAATPVAGIFGGGVLSMFAVGCPVCNKLVVMALGASGALNIWAPIQPVIGVLALGLLAYAATRRLQADIRCQADPLRG